MANRKLIVEVVGDSRSLERTFDRSTRASKVFGRELTGNAAKVDAAFARMGAGRAALIGGAAGAGASIIAPKVIDQIQAAVSAASDLNEQISKSRVVFGGSAKDIEAWSKTTAKALGVSQRAALSAAGGFGQILETAGFTEGAAAQMSRALVTLGADMASFNNITIDEALTKLRSGLAGEAEPLRVLGVQLSEGAVKLEAYRSGIAAQGSVLTEAQKVQARYNLILQQTMKQQGDVGRTSSSLANQQRRLSAQTADLQANLGTLLLPVMEELTGVANDVTTALIEMTDAAMALGRVKIPEIQIPFVVTVGGQSIGSLVGRGLSVAKFLPLFGNPIWVPELVNAIGQKIADQFDSASVAASTKLANDFAASINTMTTNALDTASRNVKPPQLPSIVQLSNADIILGSLDQAIAFAKAAATKAAAAAQTAVTAKDRAEKQRTAFDALMDALSLARDKAAVSKRTSDDLAVIRKEEQAILAQIRVEGHTTELERRLFEVRQDRADVLKGLTAQAKTAATARQDLIQARQFRALGLTATGDTIVPGVENLRKRLAGVFSRIKTGDVDVGSKLEKSLRLARNLIKREGDKLTEETRRQINDFIKAANGDDATTKLTGPLTTTQALRPNQVLAGLGLTRDVEKELRARLSQFNSAGLARGGNVGGTGISGAGQPVVINTTVALDGKTVGQNTKRFLLNDRRFNPPQKRGPNAG